MSEADPSANWREGKGEQLSTAQQAFRSGKVRAVIPCDEARREWFVMARDMYVADNPTPRVPIDLEIGIHLGGCDTTECQQLQTAYWEILRSSHPGAKGLLADFVDTLEASVIPPAPQQPS